MLRKMRESMTWLFVIQNTFMASYTTLVAVTLRLKQRINNLCSFYLFSVVEYCSAL